MRTARWLPALVLLCLSSLNAATTENSVRAVSDLPPEAQAAIQSAIRRQASGAHPGQAKGIWPQVAKLTASDFTDYFGGSVAVSGDTVAVGSPEGQNQGAVYVFTKPKTGWSNLTQTAKLTASDGQINTGLGCSVAISEDTIVAGASGAGYSGCFYSFSNRGAVYVFVKPPGGWTNATETAKLISIGPTPSHIGPSVSISGDTVVAGAPSEDPAVIPGAVYVFAKPENGWTNMSQTARLTASDGAPGDELGSSVAIVGRTIFAGAAGGGTNPGATGKAYVYVEQAGGWQNATQTAELTASDGNPGDAFGYSIAASSDSVAVGAPFSKSGAGAAYVFVEPPGGWMNMNETAELTAVDGNGYLGYSVAISHEIAVAGASYYSNGPNDREGAAFIFVKPKTGWETTANYDAKLTGSDARIVTFFGTSVGLSGGTIVAGAPWDMSRFSYYKGAAYLYTYPH